MRVKVTTYKIKNDKQGYPRTTDEVKCVCEGNLLSIVGLADRVVYVIADDRGNIKEESQCSWKTIALI